ncbi:MAG: hypothetical protein K5919_06620 [Clostridiales bacterium]|nr:hypothetical protein [Clostridiales bacterium]
MKTIIHDLGKEENSRLLAAADQVVCADGRYAPCQGCFKCWTKHPAACEMKDALHHACRALGNADELTLVTENCYGGYSPAIKNLLDRSIGTSTPLSTYRGGEMHHTLRYGKRHSLRVIVYGDMTEAEKSTLRLMAERNAVNMGFREHSVTFCAEAEEAEEAVL